MGGDDPPGLSGAPAHMYTSLPVAIFGWEPSPDQYGRRSGGDEGDPDDEETERQ